MSLYREGMVLRGSSVMVMHDILTTVAAFLGGLLVDSRRVIAILAGYILQRIIGFASGLS
jgi:hypothetical protein